MRIVSFLPSATEMLYTLGLGDQLVGVTHECDYPPEAKEKPVVVRNAIELEGFTPKEIDDAVSQAVRDGKSLYAVDEVLLEKLAPDLILTQDLCQVCAPSGNEIGRLLKHLSKSPEILWLTPKCLADIFENIRQIAEVCDRKEKAREVIQLLQKRVDAISERINSIGSRPRVFCMEWLSPPYCAGHWLGEMVPLAGGVDRLSRKGGDSVRVSWEEILESAPEVLILAPCGYSLLEAVRQASLLCSYPGWENLPAVKGGRVYAVDANAYFARPGPRVVDGIELLAHLIHPDFFSWDGPKDAFQTLSLEAILNLRMPSS